MPQSHAAGIASRRHLSQRSAHPVNVPGERLNGAAAVSPSMMMHIGAGRSGEENALGCRACRAPPCACTPQRWIAFLDAFLASTGETERRRFWRDNAIAAYRIGP
jgi:hypothetical protein